jgi:hypothetical protein
MKTLEKFTKDALSKNELNYVGGISNTKGCSTYKVGRTNTKGTDVDNASGDADSGYTIEAVLINSISE